MGFIQYARSLRLDCSSSFFFFPCKSPLPIAKVSPELKLSYVCLQNRPPRCKRITCKVSAEQDTFTVDYLMHSCGLNQEAAIITSQKVRIQSRERPDSVLLLLRKYGFSKTQISALVKRRPRVLLAHPENTLLPKLEFLLSVGFSSTDLTSTLTLDPTLFTRSLENHIIPSYEYLKSILVSDEKVVSAFKHCTWIFLQNHSKNLIPNIELLRGLGVPDSSVSLFISNFPEAAMQRHAEFRKIVEEVKELGFDTRKSTFVLAIHALCGASNKSIWKRCFEIYKRWGWSKDDILSAFKKHPHCMMLSEKKIAGAMDFFVNKMGWSSKEIAHYPVVLLSNLENRIIPRGRVIMVLVSKGLIKQDLSLNSVFLPVENYFLQRFVTKFEKEVPNLLSVYEGKMLPEEALELL